MTLPRIGIDFDGVIIDHRPHKLRLAEALGFVLEPWQTNANVMERHLEDDSYRSVQKSLYGELTVQAPPVKDALETLARLPAELYVISARRPENVASARSWMAKHRLHDIVPEDRVIFCSSGKDKREHVERLGISIFLDDKIAYLDFLPERVRRVLFDEDDVMARLAVPPQMETAASWPEFELLVSGGEREPTRRSGA